MEKHNEEQIVYPVIGELNPEKYGFLRVDGGLIFSSYFIRAKDALWRNFIINNFRDIANAYWMSMNYDSNSRFHRNRKLSTFLRFIWEQDSIDVAHIMITAINKLAGKFEENELIGHIISCILPNAGYRKHHIDGKYIWKQNNNVFESGIGKIFVINYISSGFDKNIAWREIKKYCYLKDKKWRYKNSIMKQRISEILTSYVKSGGIIVEDNVSLEFNTFMPLIDLAKSTDGIAVNTFIRKSQDGKKYIIQGVASDTSIDTDNEKITKNFIKAMKKQAVGLPLKVLSHSNSGDLDQTVGYVTKKGGDDDTFFVEGDMQPPEDNPNVKKLVDKMNFGIPFGFSIYGRVTKVIREIDKKTEKETIALDDGVLSHILITDQPANKNTFAQGIFKSFDKTQITGEKRVIVPDANKFKHNSNLSKSEPDTIDEQSLPSQAFPIVYSTGTVHKEYPHHFVQGESLYLHTGLLVKSFLKAKKDGANDSVMHHLLNHINVIGLSKAIEDYSELINNINDIEELKCKLGDVTVLLKDFSSAIVKVRGLHNTVEDKMKIINPLLSDVAQKITTIINESEESDGKV